jgi:hypothetical protein
MSRDWGRAIRKMHEDQAKRADIEAQVAWRDFVRRFRAGEFDVWVGKGSKKERFVSWEALDNFIRR